MVQTFYGTTLSAVHEAIKQSRPPVLTGTALTCPSQDLKGRSSRHGWSVWNAFLYSKSCETERNLTAELYGTALGIASKKVKSGVLVSMNVKASLTQAPAGCMDAAGSGLRLCDRRMLLKAMLQRYFDHDKTG